jgi:hypothetical protein
MGLKEELANEVIERVYNSLVIAGRVRFDDRGDCPSKLEDGLKNELAREIQGLFDALTSSKGLYRNSINGNYIVKLSTERKGRNPWAMNMELRQRLSNLRFGEGAYYGITAVPLDVRAVDESAEIQLELVMPPLVRYTNIRDYLERECNRVDGNILRMR